MASALGAAQRLEDVLAIAVEQVRVLCGAASVSVSRWEREHDWLRTLINVGDLSSGEEHLPENEVYHVADFPNLIAQLEAGKPSFVSVDDPSSDRAARRVLADIGKPSGVSIPILLDGVLWGELYATSPAVGGRLQAGDEPMLRLIADQLSLAIARAELLERLTALAYSDPLTGLGNRRALEDRLEQVLSIPRPIERPVTLLLCDLDNLKDINDGQGHDAGDAALRRVAHTLRDEAEGVPGALVCRLGGDEFCLLLEEGGPAAAYVLARKMVSALLQGGQPFGVSCGIASTALPIDRSADLLRAADSALYTAKRSGRGQICMADTEPANGWRAAAGKRRKRRDRADTDPSYVQGMLDETLQALDGPLGRASVLSRLEALATIVGAAADASGVSVSLCPAGRNWIETCFTLDRRSGVSSGAALIMDERYALEDYPVSAAVLAAASSLLIQADDPNADAAERALLEQWGMTAVLLVAGIDGQGGWLLELFADPGTRPLAAAESAVRLLVTQAVHGLKARG